MSTIFKRDNGYWYIDYRYQKKRYRHTLKTKNKTVAERIKGKIDSEIASGTFNVNLYLDNKHMQEFIDEAIAYAKTNKAATTVVRETRVLNNFMREIGDIPLSAIDAKKIEKYKQVLIDKGFKPSGVNLELRHLQAAFALAVKYKYLQSNPFREVSKIKLGRKIPNYLRPNEAKRLLLATKGHTIHDYVVIAIYAGLRAEEIATLTWDNISLEKRILTVVGGKGDKDRRIPLNDTLYKHFLDKKERFQEPVKQIRHDGLSSTLRNYCKKADVKRVTFHNLRDTFASWLVLRGVNLKVIQELLGHASITTTTIYTHVAVTSTKDAVGQLDGLI